MGKQENEVNTDDLLDEIPGKIRPEKRLWLGMCAARMTQVGRLDIDGSPLGGSKKDTDLGWSRFSDISPVMPVKRCTLSYLRKLRAVYERFAKFDVWCISSESLGMHAWHRFDSPMPTCEPTAHR